eukprot:3392683-Pleurochrysis_carterae.AAC.4
MPGRVSSIIDFQEYTVYQYQYITLSYRQDTTIIIIRYCIIVAKAKRKVFPNYALYHFNEVAACGETTNSMSLYCKLRQACSAS